MEPRFPLCNVHCGRCHQEDLVRPFPAGMRPAPPLDDFDKHPITNFHQGWRPGLRHPGLMQWDNGTHGRSPTPTAVGEVVKQHLVGLSTFRLAQRRPYRLAVHLTAQTITQSPSLTTSVLYGHMCGRNSRRNIGTFIPSKYKKSFLCSSRSGIIKSRTYY